jgi:hypothetical protein
LVIPKHTTIPPVKKNAERIYDFMQAARSEAAAIKWDAVNHRDRYLEQFDRM